MKTKFMALVTVMVLSMVLTACGGSTAATPVPNTAVPTAMMAGGTPTAMMAGETPTGMMAGETPTAMMAGGTPTGMMAGGTPTAMMAGQTPTAMMAGETPSAMMGGMTPTAMMAGETPTSGSSTGTKRKVVIASKDFTEAILVGEMYAAVLEDAGIPVDRKMNLGTTDVVQAALLKGGDQGGVDLYPEYTGSGLQAVLKQDAIADPQGTYDAVKKGYESQFKLTWLDRSPMNDTQAMVTSKEVSDSKGIKSLQDLCDKASGLTIAARAEFKDRKDALPALQKLYGGCNFKDIKVVESGDLLYKALADKQVDAAQADSTAGQISVNNLVLLADPKGYGGPYNMAPVVRDDVLAMYPNIADVLNKLAPKITTEEITALNATASQGQEPKDVAVAWLKKQGLIK